MPSEVNAPYEAGETDPARVIVELCALFYAQGWMAGTAGGMSVLDGGRIYVTPSGVQKERMRPQDVTVYDAPSGELLEREAAALRPSASAPLFRAIHARVGAGACIHTHSPNSVLVTLLFNKKFTISQIENIKAIPRRTEPGNLDFYDTLEIPIIENRAHEEELEDALVETLELHPAAPAILVRRHGVYTWGATPWKAKIIQETLEYLFDLAIRMKQLHIIEP